MAVDLDSVINIQQRDPGSPGSLLRVAQQPGQPGQCGQEPGRDGVELADMPEGELPQERPQRGGG